MTIRIALAGDTMLGRGVGERIARAGTGNLFSGKVREEFASADLSLVNLECCISDRGHPWDGAGKLFHFRAPPQAAGALADLGIDCVTLANNHALDYGFTALADTREHLSGVGIAAVGAGADVAQAREPVLLEAGGLRVAVTGVTDHPADFAAGPDRPGVAYADLISGVPDWLTGQVGALAADNDLVLVMPHWGPNMTRAPLAHVRAAARRLTDAGATLIAGHSAHVFHGVGTDGPVLYDLGDFIDDYATDPVLRNDLGLLFLVTVGTGGPERVEAVPLKLDYARTHLASGSDREEIAHRFIGACAPFGTRVTDTGGRLIADLA